MTKMARFAKVILLDLIVAGFKGIAFQRYAIAFPTRKEVEKAITLIDQRFLMDLQEADPKGSKTCEGRSLPQLTVNVTI